MSGNPFGLSELSHYGSMQRVGGKAAGFINKKFFHPSSLRNQEKLWKAQTEHSREERKQAQLEKQREEERAVEALKKQMYLRGQGSASCSDFASSASGLADDEPLAGGQKKEQKEALAEFKKRKAMLRQAAAAAGEAGRDTGVEAEAGEAAETGGAGGSSSSTAVVAGALPSLAKSVYREDVHPNGHESVWGSWYSTEDKRWGFSCCKELERKKRCPLAPEEVPSLIPKATREREPGQPRGKRRRKGGGGAEAVGGEEAGQVAASTGSTPAASSGSGGASTGSGPAASSGSGGASTGSAPAASSGSGGGAGGEA